MEKEIFDLFDLQQKLKRGVECLFPKRIWIRAEVSAVKARNGGHCYLELSQSGDDGLLAKCNAVIWSSKYRFIAPYFESVTGSPISPGMVVLVEVQVSYSELYGLSLVISDIDPDYSVGVRELERQKTIARLQAEGLMDLQSSLALPALPYRLAVVSAEDAAGYRDFMRHLHENPYGFRFETTLFPALMQGAGCPASIIAAMDAVMGDDGTYDAVLILRGGGAKLDLACFDDYGLAAVIAQFPLPVLTAIGHDQDHHVADMVAHEYVKTPTALADFFLSIYEDEDARLSTYMTRVRVAFNNRLALMESALNVLQARIKGADPRRILERGYTLALDGDGRVMKGAAGRRKGDKVSVMFADGTLKCTVEEIATSLRSSQ